MVRMPTRLNLRHQHLKSRTAMASKTYLITMRQKAPLWVGLFAILVVLMALSPHTAQGHASLLGTTPADGEHLESSPSEVVLEFSEPVGLVEGGTTLHSADSEPVVLSPQASGNSVSIPLEPLEDGAYIVQWRVISADAHPISGTVSFTVGDASAGGIAVNEELPGWAEWTRSLVVGVKYFGLL